MVLGFCVITVFAFLVAGVSSNKGLFAKEKRPTKNLSLFWTSFWHPIGDFHTFHYNKLRCFPCPLVLNLFCTKLNLLHFAKKISKSPKSQLAENAEVVKKLIYAICVSRKERNTVSATLCTTWKILNLGTTN